VLIHQGQLGFCQWEQAGRRVKKGEKAFRILSPVTRKKLDDKTGVEKTVFVGFKGTAVFGLEQTEGEPLPDCDPAVEEWIASLPLIQVAESWGLKVESFNGSRNGSLGQYKWNTGIALGVKNLSTWTHELVHAADQRNGNLKELVQHWRSETVAELGGAVLLRILGNEHDADLGGCWDYIQWYAKKEDLDVVNACGKMLERTCDAVALILGTAEELFAAKTTS